MHDFELGVPDGCKGRQSDFPSALLLTNDKINISNLTPLIDARPAGVSEIEMEGGKTRVGATHVLRTRDLLALPS